MGGISVEHCIYGNRNVSKNENKRLVGKIIKIRIGKNRDDKAMQTKE